jgi:hypothetical protein
MANFLHGDMSVMKGKQELASLQAPVGQVKHQLEVDRESMTHVFIYVQCFYTVNIVHMYIYNIYIFTRKEIHIYICIHVVCM